MQFYKPLKRQPLGKRKRKEISNREGRAKFNSNISLPRQRKKTNDSASLVLPSPPTITWGKTHSAAQICFITVSASAQQGSKSEGFFNTSRDLAGAKAEFTAKVFNRDQTPHRFQGQAE